MSSIIEFNGKKYDSLTGRILSGHDKQRAGQIDEKRIFKPEAKSLDGVKSSKKIEIKSEAEAKKPKPQHHSASVRGAAGRSKRVERPKTLMRTAVKKPKYKPAPEHKPPARVGLAKELARERAHRAKHIPKSSHIAKFSKTAPKKRSDVTFTAKPLPVAAPPAVAEEPNQIEYFAQKLEQAVQSAESHLESYTEKKLRRKRTRAFAYAFASFTSVFLIGFAIYQAVPFVQVKMASRNAGFSASLPGYSPNGYGLEKNLESENGLVAMTYSTEDNKKYKITQTPSQWNSDSLLNNYVVPASGQYERIDRNGQTIYLYDDEQSATWLDNGIWYRLEGAGNFSNDQLVRIVQGL